MDIVEIIKKELAESEYGIVISVKIRTGAPKNLVLDKMDNGVIRIAINAIPENGKANKEIKKFLSKQFKVVKNNIKIIKGETNNNKVIKIIK